MTMLGARLFASQKEKGAPACYKQARLQTPLTPTGFSLIEMLVAMVILSLSLGVLYQAAMGATRNVRVASEYTDAVMLAESMLNEYRYVPEENFQAQGGFGDFFWRISSWPVPMPEGADEDYGVRYGASLQYLKASVSWPSGSGERVIDLLTIVPLEEAEL
jgi:general secretion pathway protein I